MSRSRRVSTRALFGRRLRALRKWRTYTQEVLGEKAGVSGKLVGQIERGFGNPTLEVIVALADALKLEPAALLEFEAEDVGGGGNRPAAKVMAAEKMARYLAPRSASDLERALKILEAALGGSIDVE
jgi:transcriptional regulator with XRE-family HTH domain